MKWEEIFKKAGKKLGFSDAEITSGLADLTGDVEDNVANSRLQAIYTADEAKGNESIFGDIKKTAKAEALNPIDAEMKLVEELLSTEEKAAYIAAGPNTYEKQKIVNKAFKEAKAASKAGTGDANFDTLKQSYDDLQAKLTSDYVKKEEYEATTGKLTKAQKDNFQFKVLTGAMNEVKDSEKKKSKHFRSNFLNDFEELVTETGLGPNKLKGIIDYETGTIMRADSPQQPLMIGTEVATLDYIVPLVASEYNKGFTPPPADPLRVDYNKQPNDGGVSAAYMANLEEVKKSTGL